MKTLFGVFLVTSVLSAQPLSFGVKGGGFLNTSDRGVAQARQYLVGPAVEVGLPWNFAAEANAFYSSVRGPLSTNQLPRSDSWEFPMLGKHYFALRSSTVRPFASAGYTLRKVWADRDRVRATLFERASELEQGPVVAVGAGIKAWRLTFAPEVRYTRWTIPTCSQPTGTSFRQYSGSCSKYHDPSST
jgi:hypothetical protein